MNDLQTMVAGEETLSAQCVQLSHILGLERPVSEKVLRAAIEDDGYAHNLLASRGASVFMEYLLENPPSPEKHAETQVRERSALDLVGSAARALINWGKAGFSVVDDSTLEKRENACLGCPNLKEPENTLQKIVAPQLQEEKIGKRTGDKICGLCGCNIARKIRLSSESCPDKHTRIAGLTRWEEPEKSTNDEVRGTKASQ